MAGVMAGKPHSCDLGGSPVSLQLLIMLESQTTNMTKAACTPCHRKPKEVAQSGATY